MKKKIIVIFFCTLFIGMCVVPPTGGIREDFNRLIDNKTKVASDETSSVNGDTEYWALLIGVGVYAGHPEKNLECDISDVEDLHKMLLISEHWKEENIKVITGRRATLFNIIRGFQWLDKREDENDISVVYITTHGGQLKRDKWPLDEKDGCDEVLVTHLGFMFPWVNIRDDFLNLLLSLLNSKGVCVMVESCYSGGFNDPPYFKTQTKDNKMNANEWMHEFAEELSESGRIVLMSCREDELSRVSLFFSWLFKGLRGYADANEDRLVSAEEAFDYVIENLNVPDQHPTIFDDYPGELQLTEVELPPSRPKTPTGQIIGDTNTTYNYSTVSIDPEGGKISYGWDWDGDYILDEWSDPVDSNTTVNTPHSWTIEGTYNIRVKAKDEKGITTGWSDHIVVMMCSDNIPDQRQTIINKEGSAYFRNCWLAQSFVPSLDTLSKVDLEICCVVDPKPLHLSIRDSLSGDNLTEISRVVLYVGSHETTWHTFDFEDIDVTPGKTYFIVCTGVNNYSYLWKGKNGNPYSPGMSYVSIDGNDWEPNSSRDFCFVTWGKI